MSDVGTGILAKGRVVPEDVVALSGVLTTAPSRQPCWKQSNQRGDCWKQSNQRGDLYIYIYI